MGNQIAPAIILTFISVQFNKLCKNIIFVFVKIFIDRIKQFYFERAPSE